jgi:hypothetical protein
MVAAESLPPLEGKLTNAQIELLRLFNKNVSEEELLEIKQIIGRFFLDKFQKKIDNAVESQGYTQADFDAWLNDPNQ